MEPLLGGSNNSNNTQALTRSHPLQFFCHQSQIFYSFATCINCPCLKPINAYLHICSSTHTPLSLSPPFPLPFPPLPLHSAFVVTVFASRS
jgi:hypothetical protein